MKSGKAVQEDDKENGGRQQKRDKGGGVRKSCHKSAATKRTPAQGSAYKYCKVLMLAPLRGNRSKVNEANITRDSG